MTAVFLGAAYWSAVGLEVAAARAEGWAGARIALPTVFVFTALTFVVTLVHIDLFHLDSDLAFNTRLVTWLWLAVYGGVPVLMVVARPPKRRVGCDAAAEWSPGRRPRGADRPRRHPPRLRGQPARGPELGRRRMAVAADAAHRSGDRGLAGRPRSGGGRCPGLDHAPSLRPLGATGVLFGVLQGVALLRHGDELAWDEAPAYCYVAFLIVLTSVSLWSLLVTGGLWARRPPLPEVRQRA
jgi:hypothetical protein